MQLRSVIKSTSFLLILVLILGIKSDQVIWPTVEEGLWGVDTAFIYPLHFSIIVENPSNSVLDFNVERYSQLFFPFPLVQSELEDIKHTAALRSVTIKILTTSEDLTFPIDEQYTIETQKVKKPTDFDEEYTASITANTCYGAIRALESFSQIITYFTLEGTHEPPRNGIDYEYHYKISGLPFKIEDRPKFPWRGLLIDTARHFADKSEIFHHLDVMSWTKMNIFHWHVTDEQSFPLYLEKYPDLAKGAWSYREMYTPKDVQDIIKYANKRGIIVVPEFDLPGHSRSWGAANPDIIMSCIHDKKERHMLNLTNPETYNVTQGILEEVFPLFNSEFWNFGYDEVKETCIKDPSFIESSQSFFKEHNLTWETLFDYYFQFLMSLGEKHNRIPIIWEEPLTQLPQSNVQIPKNVIVTAWRGWGIDGYMPALKQGYRTLLTTNWYLDWIESPWDTFLLANNERLNAAYTLYPELALGGEACVWAETIDSTSREAIIWPRASVTAERLWSHEELTAEEAEPRLEFWRCRAILRGARAKPLGPGYCPFMNTKKVVHNLNISEGKDRKVFTYLLEDKIVDRTEENDRVYAQPPIQRNYEECTSIQWGISVGGFVGLLVGMLVGGFVMFGISRQVLLLIVLFVVVIVGMNTVAQ